jgi:hypothetical protein
MLAASASSCLVPTSTVFAGVGADEFERAAFAAATIFHGISDRYSSSTQPSDHSTRVP